MTHPSPRREEWRFALDADSRGVSREPVNARACGRAHRNLPRASVAHPKAAYTTAADPLCLPRVTRPLQGERIHELSVRPSEHRLAAFGADDIFCQKSTATASLKR